MQQGLPYYERFTEHFPTVQALASASEQEVLRLWQGLGYYSRARNLHSCAKTVVELYRGRFPDNFKELLSLKGIGPYTAAAIASFAFGQAVPVVDGNVYRVFSRLFGLTSDISRPSTYKEFFLLGEQLIDQEQPGTFNQAVMEFGALHCTPQKPLCLQCPLSAVCHAFEYDKQKELPVKKGKIKVKHRYFHYFLIHNKDGQLLMRKRGPNDIWQGLYDFFLIEAGEFQEPDTINDHLFQQLMAQNSILTKESGEYKHQLTHQRLHVKFFEVQASNTVIEMLMKKEPELKLFELGKTEDLPKPILIKNYLQNLRF